VEIEIEREKRVIDHEGEGERDKSPFWRSFWELLLL
jgi:hypothetical protein